MGSLRENIEAFWAGRCSGLSPLTVYQRVFERMAEADPKGVRELLDYGLMITRLVETVREELPAYAEPHQRVSEHQSGQVRSQSLHTPHGTLTRRWRNGWPESYLIEEEEDYHAALWLIEHTTLTATYESYHHHSENMSDNEVAVIALGRTPIPRLMLDWIGPENFSLHLFEFPELLELLIESLRDLTRRKAELIALGPGKYVTVNEHFSADMLGPQRFSEMILPIYREVFTPIRQAGKRVGARFDGRLATCVVQIRQAPLDVIESFYPPPIGDVTLQAARSSWPNLRIWSSIDDLMLESDETDADERIDDLVSLAKQGSRRNIAFELTRPPEGQSWQPRLKQILKLLAS